MEFLKTGGIKNRWNLFLRKKNCGIIPPVPQVSCGNKTPWFQPHQSPGFLVLSLPLSRSPPNNGVCGLLAHVALTCPDSGANGHQPDVSRAPFGVTADKFTTGFSYNSKSLSAVSPEG